jgi:tetratricopeptide (TPR) repeat protein
MASRKIRFEVETVKRTLLRQDNLPQPPSKRRLVAHPAAASSFPAVLRLRLQTLKPRLFPGGSGERLAATRAAAKTFCESKARQGASIVIGIAAIAILSCCSGGCAAHTTELQQGQAALARGDYLLAIKRYTAAKEQDPKAAAFGLCVAAFDERYQDAYLRGYCLEAIEQGNKLPDEIDENLCRRDIGEDAVQYLSTSPFCQNTAPEVKSTISASLRQKLQVEIDGAISGYDFPTADAKLGIYQHIPDASSKLIRNWRQEIIDAKARAAEEAKEEAEERKEQTAKVIERLVRRYALIKAYSQEEFEDSIVVGYHTELGTPFFSDAKIVSAENGVQGTLRITIAIVDQSVLNMDNWPTYEEINDQFVAWCGCNGTTEVYVRYVGHALNVKLSVSEGHSVTSIH